MSCYSTLVTLWTVRAACVFYVCALALWIVRRPEPARVFWTVGWLCFLGHVAAAFAQHYRWSHQVAYAETARQTADLFGFRWGGGLYFNYAFTAVWTADVAWMWWRPAGYRSRPRWIGTAVYWFMAFMFFNGAVVFASGPIRWLGLGATAVLVLLWKLPCS
jgi:hypothetical protein